MQPTLFDVRFDGPDYIPFRDDQRLTGQILKVFQCMSDGKRRTLRDIAIETKEPEASISAQLRHLRKDRFGKHKIEKNYLGNGLWEYWMIQNKSTNGYTP